MLCSSSPQILNLSPLTKLNSIFSHIPKIVNLHNFMLCIYLWYQTETQKKAIRYQQFVSLLDRTKMKKKKCRMSPNNFYSACFDIVSFSFLTNYIIYYVTFLFSDIEIKWEFLWEF